MGREPIWIAESPYRKFFKFSDENGWPDNGSYEGWWDHNTLPKLNYEGSEVLYQYVLDIAKKWLSPPYNIDGWRLDVAADLGHSPEMNHQFWRDFRKVVKETNPDALILAEHYGDGSCLARRRPVGYDHELRCLHGASFLVLNRA